MSLDEDAFLAALLPRLPGGAQVRIGPGDDCAAIALGDDTLLLLAADQLVAGTHYVGPGSPDATPPDLAGRKLLARNLSDIAAMGGTPTFALVTLAVPHDTTTAWLDAFMDGVNALAREFGVAVVGGDLARAPLPVASLTIGGTVSADEVCCRHQARPGDLLYVTGALGASLPRGHHLTFMPRIREGRWLAQHHRCRAMIDLSDGLAVDLARLCRASDVSAVLEPDRVPRNELHGVPVNLRRALTDGEDYELLLAVSPAVAPRLQGDWPFPVPLSHIGRCVGDTGDPPGTVRDPAGQLLTPAPGEGFRHFVAPSGAGQVDDEL